METAQVPQRVSRVGKRPIPLPKGVEVAIDSDTIRVKGPKGSLQRKIAPRVEVRREADSIVVAIQNGAGSEGPQYQGLMRSLIANMVNGVANGYAVALDLYGVGYRAELKASELTLNVGLSHQVKYRLPESIGARVEILDEGGTKRPRLHLDSCNKELLGQTAARIRSFRPPEPYKGKGIRYMGEKIRTKAGKAGAKGSK
jgi:large subunit ribosomal protein L6